MNHQTAPGGPIPALTCRAPWAYAILHHDKIKNSAWGTPYRGWVWLHQGRTRDPNGPALAEDAFASAVVLGAAVLADVVADHPSPFAQAGLLHFVFEDARVLSEPVALRGPGAPGLWHDERLAALPHPATLEAAPLLRMPVAPAPPPQVRRGAAMYSPDARP